MTTYQSPLGAGIKRFNDQSILDGAIAHWDPQLSTITQATGVSSYESLKGGAARTVTQANGGSQPLLVPTGINGQPALQFDGGNDVLSNNNAFLATLPVFTVIAIADGLPENDVRLIAERSTTNPQVLMSPAQTRNSAGPSRLSAFIQDNGGNRTFIDSTGPIVFDNTPHLCGTIVDTVAQTIRHFENDRIDGPDEYIAGPMTDLDTFAIGGSVSSFINTQQVFNGLIGPMAILPWAVTAAELRELTRYYNEDRGYIPSPTAYIVSHPAPAGHRLVYRDDFSKYSDVSEMVEDGAAPTQGKPFADSFVNFGVRSLDGNNDRCWKATRDNTGFGATPLHALGIEPHVLNQNGTLSLRMQEIPPANIADFQNREFAGGCITTERSFGGGYGLYKSKVRIKKISPGAHFALWLLTPTAPHQVEIDLVEIVGNSTFTDDKPYNLMFYNGHDHQGTPGEQDPQTLIPVTNDFLTQWHEYSFLHEPNLITWFVDGVQVRQEANYFDGSLPLTWFVTWEGNYNTFKDFPGPFQNNASVMEADVEIAYLEFWEAP